MVDSSGVFTGGYGGWIPLVSYLLLIYNFVLSMVSELSSSLKCLTTYIPPFDQILNTPPVDGVLVEVQL